jgi:hypothetical protein
MKNINNYNKGDVFVVNKTIWLKFFPDEFKCGGWTDCKPIHNNGKIEKGSVLTYDRDYKDTMVLTFPDKDEPSAEFFPSEIKKLCGLGVLTKQGMG